MAECQNAEENEEDIWADCVDNISEENKEDIWEDCMDNISQLNLSTSKKENKKQEVLTPGENRQSSNETHQSERSNDKNSLDNDSQPEQPESATETGNHNPNDNVPTQSEQERDDAVVAETTPYKLPQTPTEPNTVRDYNCQHFVLSLSIFSIQRLMCYCECNWVLVLCCNVYIW